MVECSKVIVWSFYEEFEILKMWSKSVLLYENNVQNKSCLAGKTLNITSFQKGDLLFFKSGGTEISGYVGEIWNVITEVLNFSLNVNHVSHTSFDSLQWNGNWTDLTRDLHLRHAHIIPYLKMDNNKRDIVDFTQPFAMTGFQLEVKSEAVSHFSWLWPLTPFSNPLWHAVLTFLISVSIIFHLSVWTVNKLLPKGKQPPHDFFSSMLLILGLFCYQDSAPHNSLISVQIMLLCTSLLAYVLVQAYAATLVSHIAAVTSWEPPFVNLEGLLQSQYSLAVINDSLVHNILKGSKGDIYEDTWSNAAFLVNSHEEASLKVCSDLFAVFISTYVGNVNNYCKVISVSDLYFSAWSCSGLVKDFPCKQLIDSTIIHLRESGILSVLRTRYPSHFKKQQPYHPPTSRVEDGVQLLQIAPILSLYAFGITFAYLILILEMIVIKCV